MTSLTDNPAVADPRKTLTKAQRDALLTIAAYRHHRYAGGQWFIGPKRFDGVTISRIERQKLIAPPLVPGNPLRITVAGQLVIEKLKSGSGSKEPQGRPAVAEVSARRPEAAAERTEK